MDKIDLKALEALYEKSIVSELKLSKEQYKKYCEMRNKEVNPKDYKIIKNHKLDEYLNKYGKKLSKFKNVAYTKNELWALKKNKQYWEIPNNSNLLYFEIPSKKKAVLIPLLAVAALAGAGAGLYFGGVIKFGPQHWYEKADWWNYCSAATEDDIGQIVKVTLDGLEHDVRLIDVDHLEPNETTPQAHCTFEFVNVITTSDMGSAYKNYWNNENGNSHNNYNFIDSTLNKLLQPNGTVFDLLDEYMPDLTEKIVKVRKYFGFKPDAGSFTIYNYDTYLFPLAHDEMIDNDDTGVVAGEGEMYAYYRTTSTPSLSRYKSAVGTTNPENYWLRSPDKDESTSAWYVNSYSGSFGHDTGNIDQNTYAIAPAFCI